VCDDSRVPDFVGENLTGSRFDGVCLTSASFHDVDLSNARFRLVDMTGVVTRGAGLKDVSISGWIDNLLVNGIDVVPLVQPGVPRDRAARPSLDEMLALRADRMATVRQVLADLTDDKLGGMTEPVTEPGYPEPDRFPVRRCLGAVVNEEWEHRLYAERDLDVLESRPS
jgi:DinB superfamily/Pentapeptide repeats (8 copies)